MRSLLSLSLLLFLPAPPQPQNAFLPTIQVNTKLTIVDVTVTDKHGHPVHGLKQSDFIIKEGGKPQPIKNFDEFGTAIIPPAQPAPTPLPPGIYTNQPAPTPTTSASNILLFDDINTGLNLVAKPELFLFAQHQAAAYLKTLPPGTRVAIMTAGNQLRLVQDFTTDKDVLYAAVSHLTYKPASGTTLPGPTGTPMRLRSTHPHGLHHGQPPQPPHHGLPPPALCLHLRHQRPQERSSGSPPASPGSPTTLASRGSTAWTTSPRCSVRPMACSPPRAPPLHRGQQRPADGRRRRGD